MAHDVFINYSAQEKAVADEVCATLESKKFKCWISPRDIPPGQPYAAAVVNAIRASRVFVLVLSKSSNLSPHVIREVSEAVTDGITIIPFRIDNVEPSGDMRHYIMGTLFWLDAITPPLEQHLEKLTDTVQELLAARQKPQEEQQLIGVEHLKIEDQVSVDDSETIHHSNEQKATLDAFSKALLREAHVLQDYPNLLWQQLYNRLQWEAEPLSSMIEPELARRSKPGAEPWIKNSMDPFESKALIRTLPHNSEVGACAISPDGKFIVSSDKRGELLKVWDAVTGNERATLRGHTSKVYTFAISPDGKFIVSASSDKTLKVWDAITGHERFTLTGHTRWVNTCVISSDGKFIVSASSDKTIKVWDAVKGHERFTLTGHTGDIKTCAISPDGKFIVSASADRTLKVWDVASEQIRLTLTGHKNDVSSCAISPDGSFIVSASWDKTLKVWDAVTGHERFTLTGHKDHVTTCAISPDGSTIVSASYFWDLKVWDAVTGDQLATQFHQGIVTSFAISPDADFIVSASADKTLKVWDGVTGDVRANLIGHGGVINACAISPDGKFIVSACKDETLKVWDVAMGDTRATMNAHTGKINACEFNPDGFSIVTASDDNTLKVWDEDATTGVRETLTGHEDKVNACAISPEGDFLVSASDDETCIVWKKNMDGEWGWAPRDERATFTGHNYKVDACAISPDGRFVVSVSEGTLKLWNPAFGDDELATLTGHKGKVNACAISPDGDFIISASEDKTLKVWDTFSGDEWANLTGHSDEVNSCAISPDGKFIVSSGDEVKVWDFATGIELATLTEYDIVTACKISPDGKFIVSSDSWERTLKVWDAKTGDERATLIGHTSEINAFAISPDGNFIISTGDDKTLMVWDATTGRAHATFPLLGAGLCLALHPRRFSIACGDNGGMMYIVDLIGLKYGPLIITAVDSDPEPTFRCYACNHSFPLEDNNLGTVITCPREYCSKQLRLNPFVIGKPRKRTEKSTNKAQQITIKEPKPIEQPRIRLGQDGELEAIIYTSSGGREVIFEPYENNYKVPDPESGEFLHTFEGSATVVTPDGRIAVSGKPLSSSDSSTLLVWDLQTAETLRTLEGHTEGVTTVDVTPDGRFIVSGSWDKSLKMWDLASGKELCTLVGHSDPVTAVTVTPDGRLAISGSEDNTLKVWVLEEEKLLFNLKDHTDSISEIVVTPDGRRAISSSEDETLKVWDLLSGKLLRTREGTVVAVTPDGKCAVSNTLGKTLKVWNLLSGDELLSLVGHRDWVNALAVTPDGRQIVSASEDESLIVWDLQNGKALLTLQGHDAAVDTVAVTPDGISAVSGSRDKTLRIWDLKSGVESARLTSPSSIVACTVVQNGLAYIVHEIWDYWHFLGLESIVSHPLIITAIESGSGLVIRCPVCLHNLPLENNTLGTVISCPNPACSKLLRVNPFVLSSSQIRDNLAAKKNCKIQTAGTNEVDPPTKAENLRIKGKELLNSGESEQAIDYFDRGLKLQPNDLTLLDLRVSALLKLERYQEALDTLDYVLDKHLATGRNLGNMYAAKGHALAGLRNYEEALNYYRRSLDIVTTVSMIWYMQGFVLHQLGDFEAALDSFKRARQIEDNEVTNIYISYCYMQMEDYSEAEQVYRNMLEHGSSNPIVYHGLGLALVQQQENDEAYQWLQRFIDNAQAEHAHLVPQVQQINDKLS